MLFGFGQFINIYLLKYFVYFIIQKHFNADTRLLLSGNIEC